MRNTAKIYNNLGKCRQIVKSTLKFLEKKQYVDKEKEILQEVNDVLKYYLKVSENLLKRQVRNMTVWRVWLSGIKGISQTMAGRILAKIDINKCGRVSSLWRYAGFAVKNGKAERKTKGNKSSFNPVLKAEMVQIAKNFIRQKNKYYKYYLQQKEEEAKKHPELSRIYIHNRARRKMIKLFAKHLWLVWRQTEGLPIPSTFYDSLKIKPEEVLDE